MTITKTLSLLITVLPAAVRSLELRGSQIHFVAEGNDGERMLDEWRCPKGQQLYETDYNVLFDVTSNRQVSCSPEELASIGAILEDEYSDVLLNEVGSVPGKTGYELQSVTTNICNDFGNNSKDSKHRKLQTTAKVFQVYLYRSIGKCYMCAGDDRDRRRQLQSQMSATASFANQLSVVDHVIDSDMTDRLLMGAQKDRLPCMRDIGAEVHTTLVIKPRDEPHNACGDVFCCVDPLSRTQECMPTSAQSALCHASEHDCVLGCQGAWVNAML